MSRGELWVVQNGREERRGRSDRNVENPEKPGWIEGWGYPTWSDEFDYVDEADGQHKIDPDKWNVRTRSTLGLLNDASVVDDSAITVTEGGICQIAATWLDEPVVTTTGPSGNPTNRWHQTGYMEHRRNDSSIMYSQRYGIWEYRVKMPMVTGTSLGTLAAMWLRNGSTGELDMTEGWGSGPSTMTANSLHPAGLKPNTGTTTLTMHTQTSGSGNVKKAWTITPAVYDTWNTYRLEWTPSVFRFTVNGTVKIEEFPSGSSGYFWTDPAFTSPWYLRCNLHIGPSTQFWGLPDPDHPEWTADPQLYEIDYVRCYAYTE